MQDLQIVEGMDWDKIVSESENIVIDLLGVEYLKTCDIGDKVILTAHFEYPGEEPTMEQFVVANILRTYEEVYEDLVKYKEALSWYYRKDGRRIPTSITTWQGNPEPDPYTVEEHAGLKYIESTEEFFCLQVIPFAMRPAEGYAQDAKVFTAVFGDWIDKTPLPEHKTTYDFVVIPRDNKPETVTYTYGKFHSCIDYYGINELDMRLDSLRLGDDKPFFTEPK